MKSVSFFLPVLTAGTFFFSVQAQPVSSNVSVSAVGSNPAPGAVPAAAASDERRDAGVREASAAEILKMRDAGLEPAVIRAYIQAWHGRPYKATVEDIVYLHEHKVPDDLISEWIKKGGEVVATGTQVQSGQYPARSPDLVASATPNPLPVTQLQQPEQQAQPQVVYQAPAAPTVVYSSPTYAYTDPYWYTPSISLGFSWGYPYYGHGYYHGGHYNGGHYGGGHYGGHGGGGGGGHGGHGGGHR